MKVNSKTGLTVRGVQLLRKAVRAIKRKPERLNMGDWMRPASYLEQGCGTIACIAGFVVLEAGYPPKVGEEYSEYRRKPRGLSQRLAAIFEKARDGAWNRWVDVPDLAITLLTGKPKVEQQDNETVNKLFHVYSWPFQFRDKYNAADDAATRAKIVEARVEHFLKTGK